MRGKARTKSEERRFLLIQERGCVPCYLEAKLKGRKWRPEPCDIHHTESQDHKKTYGNCPWHHRGVPKLDVSEADMRFHFGPSMAKEPERYRVRYGTEREILAYQEKLLLKSLAWVEGATK